MTFIVDPLDEEVAIDPDDGELLGAVRILPLQEGITPTVAQLSQAPIIGYAGPDAFSYSEDDDE